MDKSNDKRFLSHDFHEKVLNHYKFLRENDHQNLIFDSEYIMRMPHNLREALYDYIYEADIERFSCFFRDSEKQYVYRIISHMEPKMFATDDIIIACDSNCSELYFITSGIVNLENESGQGYISFGEHSYFGEDLIMFSESSSVNYISITRSTVLCVKDSAYFRILSQFPDELRRSQVRAFIRRNYLKAIEDAADENLESDQLQSKIEEIISKFSKYEEGLTPDEEEELKDLITESEQKNLKSIEDLVTIAKNFSELSENLKTFFGES